MSAQTVPSLFDRVAINALLSETNDIHKVTTSDSSMGQKIFLPRISPDGRVDILITLEDASTPTDCLEAEGLVTEIRMGRCLLASAPPEAIGRIAAADGVTAIRLDAPLREHNNISLPIGGIDKVHAGTPDLPSFTGKGVIAGIMDRGLEPNHVSFLDADGKSRVKKLTYFPDDARSDIYDTPEAIGAYTSDYTIVTHGTHVLGTFAGGHVTTDSGEDYCGVAPDTEIVLTSGVFTETNLVRGLASIHNYAEEAGKPCVVNLSLGNNFGPHDGSDPLTSMLNEFASLDDMTLVISCGNEGSLPVALTGTFTEERPYVETAFDATEAALYTYNPLSQGVGKVQVWSEDDTPVKVEIIIRDLDNPDEPLYVHEIKESGNIFIGTGRAYMGVLDTKPLEVEPMKTNYSNGYLGGECSLDPSNNRYKAELMVYLTSRSQDCKDHVATTIRVTGEPGKRVFIYNENSELAFSAKDTDWLDAPTADGTVSSICCGSDMITVGAYATRNVDGSPYPAETIGDVCSFSSWANLADGRTIPDVVAPGLLIFSALNSYMHARSDYESSYSTDYPTVDTYTSPDGNRYYWTLMGGTSMAAPYVSGAAALMLSANPDLTSGQLRDILRSTTSPSENPAAGYGKIDPFAAVAEAYSRSSLRGIESELPAEVSVTDTGNGLYRIHAPGEFSISATVYDISGITVSNLNIDSDNGVLDLSFLPSGIYVISVRGSKTSASVKISR